MTTDRDAPWWRSDGDRLAGDEDPVALHLAARNGEATDPPGGGRHHEAPDAEPTGDGAGPRADRSPSGGAGHVAGPDCDVCPICLGIAHVREAHPEVADHLVDAVRHLTLAVRSLVDDVGSGRRDATDDSGDVGARGGHATSRRRGAGRARGGTAAGSGFVSIPLDDLGGPQ